MVPLKSKTNLHTILSRSSALLVVILLCCSGQVFGQSLRFDNALVSTVLQEIEETYGTRFLYRDALVAGKRISLSGDRDEIIAALEEEMRDHDLTIGSSGSRDVMVVTAASKVEIEEERFILGFVIDAETGSRLPGASILLYSYPLENPGSTLRDDPQTKNNKAQTSLTGTITNVDGRFSLQTTNQKPQSIEVRYIGYESYTLELSDDLPSEISIRLKPIINSVSEVTVYGNHFQSSLDSTWHFLMQPSLPSGYDDQSLLRDFQVLPAIAITSAVSGDINVRGSQSSGFRVELDGAPVFGQQHLFGLYDVFNPDAISQSALYYGASPSTFEDAGGGILSLKTRPGSMTSTRAMASLSNSTGSLSIETPLIKERASLMISGRSSTPYASTWYGSENVIARGLGIPVLVSTREAGLEQNLFEVDPTGSFYDLHSRAQFEFSNGSRIDATGYFASEKASAESTMLIESRLVPSHPIRSATIDNEQNWENNLGKLSYAWAPRANLHLTTTVTTSNYEAEVFKEDFVERGRLDTSFALYQNVNTMSEHKLSQQGLLILDNSSSLEIGLRAKKIRSSFTDILDDEQRVNASIEPTILDGSLGYNLNRNSWQMALGLRNQYDLERGIQVLSPKIHLAGSLSDNYSATLSLSRNNEFVQNLDLGSELRSNIWFAGNEESKPTETNTMSLSNQIKLGSRVAFRVDAYVKKINNLWEYRAGLRTEGLDRVGVVTYESESLSRGIELMSSFRLSSSVQASANYTWSHSEVWNVRANNSERFDAEWDRRHQFSSRLRGDINEHFSFSVTGLFATGAPNDLQYLAHGETERLGNYFRIDAGLDSRWVIGGKPLFLSFFVFNATNRENPWYRTPVSFVNRVTPQGGDQQPRFLNVDVFDLGIIPSFKLRLAL